MAHLLGLDIGSTRIKAVRFDAGGRVLATAATTVKVQRPRAGWVERDAEETWRAAAATLRDVARSQPGRIVALGVTGCGNGAVFLDKAGRPLRAGILSSDTRANAFLSRHSTMGQQPYAGQLPALLAWLRKHEAARARRLASALFWKDFIRLRLTGCAATDFTDAGAAGLLRFPSRRLRFEDGVFPPLQESLSRAGGITAAARASTGLPAGLPVYTGCIDCEAAAIGSGVKGPGEVSIVAGTWSINQAFVGTPPSRKAGHFLINPSAESGRWLVMEGGPCSAANLEWAAHILDDGDIGRASALAERARRSSLLFIPFVPTGRGALIGLAAMHDRGAIYRAVMEGVVFAHRVHLEKLTASTGCARIIRLSGGATRSAFWCQLFADGLGCTVTVSHGGEPGALGAALCAGVGHGLWTSLAAAQSAMVGTQRLFHPRPSARRELQRDFLRYRQILDSLAL